MRIISTTIAATEDRVRQERRGRYPGDIAPTDASAVDGDRQNKWPWNIRIITTAITAVVNGNGHCQRYRNEGVITMSRATTEVRLEEQGWRGYVRYIAMSNTACMDRIREYNR